MSVINKATISFIQNGEAVVATVLNRALNQTIDQINAHDFGENGTSYNAGDGINIITNSISVNNTVLRTTGNFTVNGVFTFGQNVTATGFVTTSDKRLKDDISDFQLSEEDNTIKLKQWNWAKSDAVPVHLHGCADSGIIADDVEKVFPNCVYINDNGFKTVDYGKLAVHLILSKG